MYPELRGKVALVTGASTGIGAAAARRFAAEGVRVAINYLASQREAEAVREEISREGEALLVQGDVASKSDVVRIVANTVDRFGGIDILVNNAGSPVIRSTIEQLSEADWDRTLGINLKGIFLCSQAVIPHMRRRRGGRIINVTSIVGSTGESSPHYATAKGGANTLTKALARELAADGIAVNAVAPGLIDTPAHGKFSPDPQAIFERVVPRIPLQRVGQPEDVASWIAYLASDQASFVTGQIIAVDGGQVMV